MLAISISKFTDQGIPDISDSFFFPGKIIELVDQSKGWSSVDQTTDSAENVMKGISEEELYNLPTGEYVHRRGGFIFREFTVYHVAFHAFADLRDTQVTSEWPNSFIGIL